MNTNELRALQAQILANHACQQHVITNDMPRIASAEAFAKDAAIAEILSVGRTRLAPFMISERGVRANLPIKDGALFIKTLRDLSEASDVPAWLSAALGQIGVAEEDKWAYFDTLQCGYTWLRADGLDVGEATVRQLLDLLGLGVPPLAGAIAHLKSLGMEPDPITAADVSLALRGPWGDE